jgi:oligoribonuclease NrnB/cAMP/cGMP phosphodiesterase (DHH superfamily)
MSSTINLEQFQYCCQTIIVYAEVTKGKIAMICIHHNDLDGHCSAAIVRKYYLENPDQLSAIGKDMKFVEMDYSKPFPYHLIEKDEIVIIVDFSPTEADGFKKILEITGNIIWIDHHGTAIHKHRDMASKIMGIQIEGAKAACELTWEYFYSRKMPRIVELLGDYDTHTFKYEESTKYCQLGCKAQNTNPTNDIWLKWLSEDYTCQGQIIDGGAIYEYLEQQNKHAIRQWSYDIEFEGYLTVCCNGQQTGGFFGPDETEGYDICLIYLFTGTNWRITIFTERDDIDVSKLAIKYGGGGHPKAAGFICEKFPAFLFPPSE